MKVRVLQRSRYKVWSKSAGEIWRRFRKNRAAVFGLLVIAFFGTVAAASQWIAPRHPSSLVGLPFLLPDSQYLLGTDDLGRDMVSRVVHGARVSLTIGVMAALTATIIGILVGAFAGFYGGLLDDLLMRLTEILFMIPRIFIALVVVALFGPAVTNVILVIGLLSWPVIARIVRAEFLSLKEREFVEAARSLGSGNWDLMFSEILPNGMAPVVVATSLQVGQAILTESTLAFLGLGDPTVPSWGTLLNAAQPFLEKAWWMSFFPGLSLALTVLGFNVVGDGLNDAINPALKER